MGDRRKKYLSQWEIEKVVEEDLPSDTSSIDWDSDDSSNDPDFPDPTTSLTVTCPSDTCSDSNDETPTTVPVNRPQQSSNVVTSSLVCENPDDAILSRTEHLWNKTQRPVPAPSFTSQCGPTDCIQFETPTASELFLTLISDEVLELIFFKQTCTLSKIH